MKGRPEQPAGHGEAMPDDPIAITGFGGVFPGARTLEEFWRIIERGVDTSRPVPAGRWVLDPEAIRNSVPGTPDSVYTERGCFIEDFRLESTGLNLPAGLLEVLDPSFHLLLEAGRAALASTRTESLDRRRVGVILGNIVLPTTASSALCERLLNALAEPGSPGCRTPPRLGPEAWNRSVAGLPAGVLAQALGLGGGSCTLDAACASSLYALKLACDELRAGRVDAMLAGGLSRPDSLYTQMGFCQLRALATSGRCAPFDVAGSGLIVGEGAGVVVLKRVADALRDGDQIHALIRGIGLSNDLDGNLLSPSSEGQLRALRLAYRQAGWSPAQVDLIECHATGTPVGDAVEFESLSKLWQAGSWQPGQCVLGAVKANIGHLLTAAGSASLIKILLALRHRTLPVMANFRQPAERVALEGSPFRILQASQPWPQRDPGTPRRAAINGFGFGGINAHVLIEEWLGQAEELPVRPRAPRGNVPVAIVGLAARVGPWQTLRAFQERVLGGDAGAGPTEPASGRGLGLSADVADPGQGARWRGYYLEELAIPVNRYRIPPKELAELLPQQALMLEAARDALADAQLAKPDARRAGVFVGLGLDPRTNDFHSRWAALARGGGQVPANAGPPLTADRTMGSLAGITASRIAKEFHFGGPSHTLCAEECSGTKALEVAVRALQQGELDQALVGAVDLTGDRRGLLASDAVRAYSPTGTARPFDAGADGVVPGEGAVALVLKRLEDARWDGDRVYAVVRGIGCAGGEWACAGGPSDPVGGDTGKASRLALERAYAEAGVDPASVEYVETPGAASPEEDRREAELLDSFFGSSRRKNRCRLGAATADVGHLGAAAGLVSVVKACLALYQEILPPLRGLREPGPALAGARHLLAPTWPQYWVRDRADGPRRAGVNVSGLDGNRTHLILEACEDQVSARLAQERLRPLGAAAEVLLVVRAGDEAGLQDRLRALRALAVAAGGAPLESLARRWWTGTGETSSAEVLAVVARDGTQLVRLLDVATEMVERGERIPTGGGGTQDRDRIFYVPPAERVQGGTAFVFPGAGNCFPEMGRELAVHWPEVLRAQDQENQFLASQMCAESFWNARPAGEVGTDHRAVICGQVTLGTFLSDLATHLGLKPEASVGYSLGESTGLFALRAWTARDEMWHRVSRSSLFAQDLTGRPEQLRRVWGVPEGEAVEWQAGLVDRSAAEVRAALEGRRRVYVLIVNTPGECVIGGEASQVREVVAQLGCHWFPLEGVSTVHCELLRPFEAAYHELHCFETIAPAGVRFYSGGWGRAYQPDRETAAAAIVAQASDCIDFPRVVRAAYDSGVRFFLEMGPGNSCSRMIGQILEGRPHLARSWCASENEPLLGVLRVLGQLLAQGVAVDLDKVYGAGTLGAKEAELVADRQVQRVRIAVTSPLLFARSQPPTSPLGRVAPSEIMAVPADAGPRTAVLCGLQAGPMEAFEAQFFQGLAAAQTATLEAHQAYLDFSQGLFESLSRTVESQMGLISALAASGADVGVVGPSAAGSPVPAGRVPAARLDRAACLEFARGTVAKVLGPEFSRVDTFPTRVRLPDEPLMLVDRILEIEGEARSMTHGRVVTEHDIHAGAWYLDGGRIPTCIAVEAGQADLFLSGYLGIDFQTEGRAVYRLLDAKVCFHRGLPGPGAVIHYDIQIDHFFRQGGTWLFRFHFEATVAGEPLLTMTEGCAGFFSAEELAGGRGVVRTSMDLQPMPGKRPADWQNFVAMEVEAYSEAQLEALRAGDLAGCFGPRFAGLALRRPVTLPSGQMRLVHRIPHLDPVGGRFGLGLIRGEADIHPTDWFLTCHFVDDRVMPGTLMFECCLHTLRVFLLRMGWVVEQDQAVLEPVPGVQSQLKCRGQVLETTRTVTYEVVLKELGYRPEPYVLADALMYADGKPIVEITNMSLRYAGVTREGLHQIWAQRPVPARRGRRGEEEVAPVAAAAARSAPKPALYDYDRILAFAIGKPSVAFGPPYEVFDSKRRIARLPGPPYQFLDRITEVRGEPFKMVAGGLAEAQYDVPAEAWYFAENRQGDMPFAVLLEIALQPCGWLAAYAGSALTSELDLSFRNLGGTGTQLVAVHPGTGTLTTRVNLTRVSSSAGMIIQWFDFEVRSAAGLIYQGDTYFGFFPQAALARQEGLQNPKLHQLDPAEQTLSRTLAYPVAPPFAGDPLRMVDQITAFLPAGGPHRLGFIRGTKRVQPEEWFFKAHFYQDPVVPGSLGLESFLQLLKFVAVERWGHAEGTRWTAVALGQRHEWTYRGQIVPSDRWVTVEVVVTAVEEETHLLKADGYLSVDGRVIYGLKDFTVRQDRTAPPVQP